MAAIYMLSSKLVPVTAVVLGVALAIVVATHGNTWWTHALDQPLVLNATANPAA